jgi:multiple sugar transport system permease protein
VRGARAERAWWAGGAVLVLGWTLGPLAWLVSLSLKPAAELADRRFLPRTVTLEHYRAIFHESQFTAALVNSVGIAAIATVLAVLLATSAAWAIARLDFPGRGVLLAGSLATAMFPPIAIVGPLFDMWRALGLFDTWAGLVIPYMTFALPLAIWMLAAFFREIPPDLERAARVDGATRLQAFRRVVAPVAAPGMVAAAILVFVFAWNDFLFAMALTSTDRARTVPAALAFFSGDSQFQQPTGSIAAAAVVVTVPVVMLVLLFQRRIVAGLTAGAVKG